MKKWILFSLVVIGSTLAIVIAERQAVNTKAGAQGLMQMAADAQHEVANIPLNLDHMSDEDEIRIGNELANSYQTNWQAMKMNGGHFDEVEAYLQEVGTDVSSHARRKLPYKFHYIPDPSFVNAFALPGGHIFVGEGLLKLMHSEDALASVLGHEVEHIDLRHCTERLETEAKLRNLGVLGDLLSLPVEVFTTGYTKQQEMDADRYGTALAVTSKYSPNGILQLLTDFAKLEHKVDGSNTQGPNSPVEEAVGLPFDALREYFRSHPPAEERRIQITKLIQAEHWDRPPLRPLYGKNGALASGSTPA